MKHKDTQDISGRIHLDKSPFVYINYPCLLDNINQNDLIL